MKYFVVSDIHSFFDEFKKAIDEAGFDPKNENHTLVICGDLFDRGRQPIELIRYLNHEVPRKILIRGNHEDLFEDMCKRGEPWIHDYSNGTCQTAFDLTGVDEPISFERRASIALVKIIPLLNQMVDYYETEKYVFVHSTIPLKEDWRHANTQEWKDARWDNPFKFWEQVGIDGKTVVFGHFHTSWAWSRDGVGSEWGTDACFDPYYGDGFIGLDACTVVSHKVNVIVLEDNLINNKMT